MSCKSAVLMIFFNRPDTLEKVFAKVREAKPEKLYLAQDGPRNDNDLENIMKCREIVDNIDWECEVHKDYLEKNIGCGMRPQTAISNVLKNEESVIILEDDCVPDLSFFNYCDEMLERYKDDDRICYISGLNHFEYWDCDSDYFFTKTGAIWGWATWARVWNKYYDYKLQNVKDGYELQVVGMQFQDNYAANKRIKHWKEAKKLIESGEKISFWDNQWGYVKYSQNMLVIVPKYNLIRNVGVGDTSTHAQRTKNCTYKRFKNFFNIPTKSFPVKIKHPNFVACDYKYDKTVYKCTRGNPLRTFVVKVAKRIIGRGLR